MTDPPPTPQGIPPRRPRHLLDPADLRGSHQRSQGTTTSLDHVRTWVASVLAVTTILHFSVGAAVAARFVDTDRPEARIGLVVMATLIGAGAVATGLVIHRRDPRSAWLLLGLLPGVLAVWMAFG